MALINCPDCGKPVSTQAPACPNCGRFINRPQEGFGHTILRGGCWLLIGILVLLILLPLLFFLLGYVNL